MPDKFVSQDASGDAAVEEVTVSHEVTDGEAAEVVTEHRRSQIDGEPVTEVTSVETRRSPHRNRNLVIVAAFALLALIVLVLLVRSRNKPVGQETAGAEAAEGSEKTSVPNEVALSPDAMKAAGIVIEGVTQRPAVSLLRVTGTVESNQQQTQSVTPLVSGRVERVNVALGDRVNAGTVIAVISSPEIAELRGKLHDATTRVEIAERNYARVQRAENRVAVLQAKAKLDEADATLKRTRRLIELGAGAGKDLNAAQADYLSAKADYDFQSNISLNREIQEARAAVETARVDVTHVRDQLRAFGASVPASNAPDDHSRNTSYVTLYAPVSGTVTERLVNAGAGIQAGTALFTIANISTVWVVASVPEAQVGLIHPGTPAEVRSTALGSNAIAGQVSYIDPQLNEGTRTARVRIVVANPGERLKVGMFADVGFQTSTGAATGEELVVPASAVQRLGAKTIVFMAKQGEAGVFVVREIEVGGETDGYARIISGLSLGESVVTTGAFTLKTQLEKGSLE